MTANNILIAILDKLQDGRARTAYTIAQEIGAPMKVTKEALNILEQRGQIIRTRGTHYQIRQESSQPVHPKEPSTVAQPSTRNSPKPATTAASVNPPATKNGNDDQLTPILVAIAISVSILTGGVVARIYPTWMLQALLFIVVGLILILIACICFTVHLASISERWVIFRAGKCMGERGPGWILVIPFIDQVAKVDMSDHIMRIAHEQCITQDNVSVDVDFAIYWRVRDAVLSTRSITKPELYLQLRAIALLRDVLALVPFGEIQTQREYISEILHQKLEKSSLSWGIGSTVEILEIRPSPEMATLMQLQATTEWKRRIAVSEAEGNRQVQEKKAEGDAAAMQKLNKVAAAVDDKLLQMRYLDTLSELGKSASTKFILPVELIDLVRPFAEKLKMTKAPAPPGTAPQSSHKEK